jgi:hypothetical protein
MRGMFVDPLIAQKEKGILLRSQFSNDEISQFHELGRTSGAKQPQRHWKRYLHAHSHIKKKAALLFGKMITIMQTADANEPRWRAWQPSFSMRVVEYHQYTAGGGLTKKCHFDDGSCFTMVIMLSRPEIDFQDGHFLTWEQVETAHNTSSFPCKYKPVASY